LEDDNNLTTRLD